MVATEPHSSVTLVAETILKATETTDHTLHLSNLDFLLTGGMPVTLFHAYSNPSAATLPAVTAALATSLPLALDHFPPFAGRILRNPRTSEPEIQCNNQGVRLLEASADFPLAGLDFHDMRPFMKRVILPAGAGEFLLSVQVTGFSCGCFSVSWTFDHQLTDAHGFLKFLTSWSELATTGRLTAAVCHDRSAVRPRAPPAYGPLVGRIYKTWTPGSLGAKPETIPTEKRLYLVNGAKLERLRSRASDEGSRRTRNEALAAHLWRLFASSLGESAGRCRMAIIVDGRKRISPEDAMSDYVGNVLSMAVWEGSVREVREGSLAWAAAAVSKAIGEVANRTHFEEVVDFIELHRPEPVVGDVFLGAGAPAIVVSSCVNLPVAEVDFGLGRPAVGMFVPPVAEVEVGFGLVNLVSTGSGSGSGDGSWLASVFVCAELAAAFDSDPERVFEPLTADCVFGPSIMKCDPRLSKLQF